MTKLFEGNPVFEALDDADYSLSHLALAQHLGIDPSEITPNGTSYGNMDQYEVPESGEEYGVATDQEADDACYEDIENLMDDAGWCFNLDIADYVQGDWFDEAMKESYYYYAQDIKEESDDVYKNRLVQEMVENGVVDEETALNPDFDEDEYFDDFVDRLCEGYDDAVQWYKDNFGEESIGDLVREGRIYINMQELVDDLIRYDGRGHILNRYDGNEDEVEIEGETFYIYRFN